MTATPVLAAAPEPDETSPNTPADAFHLPEEWSEAARDAFREVLQARPELAGAEVAALECACELITTAGALDAVAKAADYVATGSQDQEVLHPAVAEARLSRTAAASILARLVAVATGPTMTNSQRGTMAARARWAAR